ncbi:hypothetical protein [Arthrobacter sp. TMS2-4]
METDLLPRTAGSAVEYDLNALDDGFCATLAPTTWDPRTHTFSDLVWCAPGFTGTSFEVGEIWPVPAKRLRHGRTIHVGSPPKPTRKKPLRRIGTIALLDNTVYTYCPMWLRNGCIEHAAWLNPAAGIALEDIERHGTELVAGLP